MLDKVLLVNDLARCGGTEAQHWMEFELLRRKGHEVVSLTFDPAEREFLDGDKLNLPISQNPFEKAICKLFKSCYYAKIAQLVDSVQPDVIHLNNNIKVPIDVYDVCSRYPAVQTIRDYGAVCPKSTCADSNWHQCYGFKGFSKCLSCGPSFNEKIKAASYASLLKKRMSSVNLFVAPSKALCRTCGHVGLEVEPVNDAASEDLINKPIFGAKKQRDYLFYGGVRRIKGVVELINAFDALVKIRGNRRLLIAGKVESDFEKEFDGLLASRPYVKYLGLLDRDAAMRQVVDAYCVVVPSLWIENYPNTVLEAMCLGTLVVGADRGGIPEMIDDDNLVFDVLDDNSIIECLVRVDGFDAVDYAQIVRRNKERVRLVNTPDCYYTKIVDSFKRAKIRHRDVSGA